MQVSLATETTKARGEKRTDICYVLGCRSLKENHSNIEQTLNSISFCNKSAKSPFVVGCFCFGLVVFLSVWF
jgi:hypothetical protein